MEIETLTAAQWCILGTAAFLFGVSKTGIPGMGILGIPLVALVVPARASTGLILPMLIIGDCFAVGWYRRHAEWPHLIRLIPWAIVGVLIGYALMGQVNDAQLRPVIGAIILVVLGLSAWRQRRLARNQTDFIVPTHWSFGAVMGVSAGITTMMANAAGPIMIIYLLAMRLPKDAFIGTGAWYFLLVNCFKVPFSMNLGLITLASFQVNLMLAPVIAVGAVLGIVVLRRIPQEAFNWIAQILAALAAVKLLF
ncbi:MAG: hypothetical protein A3K19_28950 [Lentisphaerae bacterium RIFOXYB12_FULL_65_16]|nr:MAG: hypothetical protein A3K18_25535 [Lentisphaerae bacterium RIFOXYA12_64_32]OGV88322.1 MAG: hypothetical protein A3K19_28950 [Lentisphaerae bacterium RIFOXYB12_FULL_65_16]